MRCRGVSEAGVVMCHAEHLNESSGAIREASFAD